MKKRNGAIIRHKIVQVKDNKLVVYLITRYITYFIQFLTSLLLANKLGPTNYGTWGFMLLLISYFSIFNFGFGNSINVLLVQNRLNANIQNEYIKNDLFLVSILGSLIVSIMIVYVSTGMTWFEHYGITFEFLIICIIAILGHYNLNLTNISRVKNDFYRIAFNQSIIPVLWFFCTIFFNNRYLLIALLSASLVGNIFSITVFLYRKQFCLSGIISKEKCLRIITKGWWLFIYNLCFYLVLLSTRTLISSFYSVKDFGFFSFSFTLGDAVLLLFQAAANIVFPKVLAKLGDEGGCKSNVIKKIDQTFVFAVYLAVLFVCCLFPYILLLFPDYHSCNVCMSLVAMAMAMNTNSYAYTSYLMINNKERVLVGIALISLLANIIIALLIIKVMALPYSFVIISTLISYYLFYALCVKAVQMNSKENLKIFNWRLHLPLFCAIVLTVSGLDSYVFIAIIFLFIVNRKNFQSLISLLKMIWNDYRIINV